MQFEALARGCIGIFACLSCPLTFDPLGCKLVLVMPKSAGKGPGCRSHNRPACACSLWRTGCISLHDCVCLHSSLARSGEVVTVPHPCRPLLCPRLSLLCPRLPLLRLHLPLLHSCLPLSRLLGERASQRQSAISQSPTCYN